MSIDETRSPILVADDNPTDVFFLQRRLLAAGITNPLRHFEDGFEAVQWLEQHLDVLRGERLRPWLLFVDLKMPRMDGFEVLQWISARRLTDYLTVSVLSTSDEPVDILRASQLGAHRFLVKYPEPAALMEVVQFAEQRANRASLMNP